MNGSSSTYHSDVYWISTATGRVVYRGYNNANANGGVSNANANNDASNANTNVGSRLTNNNRRTTMGTCPRCGAEGGKPQQKQFFPMFQILECFGKLKNHVSGNRVW